ncbi:MAG: glycosyltransferase family A protein, partial [bacterium]|nr:glycosyltransferase family A protein [bacterium]
MSNPPNMHIILTAYGLANDLYRLVDTADGKGITWHLFLHSNYPDVVEVCEELDEMKNVHFYDYRVNRGLAKSWNEGFYLAYEKYGADATFIASDDAICTYDEVATLANKAIENPSAYMVSGWGREIRTNTDGDMLFSMAAITRKAIREVGY